MALRLRSLELAHAAVLMLLRSSRSHAGDTFRGSRYCSIEGPRGPLDASERAEGGTTSGRSGRDSSRSRMNHGSRATSISHNSRAESANRIADGCARLRCSTPRSRLCCGATRYSLLVAVGDSRSRGTLPVTGSALITRYGQTSRKRKRTHASRGNWFPRESPVFAACEAPSEITRSNL